MAVRIQFRRDSSANWTLNNPILSEGEVGLELDTGRLKFGNGVDGWNTRPYSNETFSGPAVISSSGTQATFRVIQTGSGNAFEAYDSADPDSTPFVINNVGNVGIGTASPIALLDVSGNSRFSGQITSTVLNGTPAFVVASSTMISNLNADLLDGQHGAYYASASSPTFTGIPVAPTASVDTSTTQIATTEFVINQNYAKKSYVDNFTISKKTNSYSLLTTDAGTLIEMESSSALTVTIPQDSSQNFPIGATLEIIQTGTGQVTLVADSGVTIQSTNGLKLSEQYSAVTIYKRSANTWLATGDLSP